MHFHYLIMIFLNHTPNIRKVSQKAFGFCPDMVYTAAHGPDFRFVIAGVFSMNHKIKLYFFTVDMSIKIHQHGFHAAAIHHADYM